MFLIAIIAIVAFVLFMAAKSKQRPPESKASEKASDRPDHSAKSPLEKAVQERSLDPRWEETVNEPPNNMYPEDYLSALEAQKAERKSKDTHYDYVVLDFETTGLDGGEDEILQVAIVDDAGNSLINQMCKPTRVKKWEEAVKVNNIWPKDVAFCPTFAQISEYVQDILMRAGKVVSYNNQFEKWFLKGNGIDPKLLKWARDPMRLATQYYNIQKGANKSRISLERIAKMLKLEYTAHDALGDATATRQIYEFLREWAKQQRELAKVSAVDAKAPPQPEKR